MSKKNYAFIKNNNIINIAVFENPSEELLNHFKNEFDLDLIIEATNKTIIGGTYDGKNFWSPKPYPSWIKNEELNEWEAPISYPNDGEHYIWDEESISWLLLPPSNQCIIKTNGGS